MLSHANKGKGKGKARKKYGRYLLLKKSLVIFIIFILVMTLLASQIVIPEIDDVINRQHESNMHAELNAEVELFIRQIEIKKNILDDVTAFPAIVSSVMLMQGESEGFIELFNSFMINGEKARLVLQDIEGNIVAKTFDDLQGFVIEHYPWMNTMLNGDLDYALSLKEQINNHMFFSITVPVKYSGYVEGFLTAEMKIDFKDIFPSIKYNNVAFRVSQENVEIKTSTKNILMKHEVTSVLNNPKVIFTFITDDKLLYDNKMKLKKRIYLVLFSGLFLSFILFYILTSFSMLQKQKDYSRSIRKVKLRFYTLPGIIGIIGCATTFSAYMLFQYIEEKTILEELRGISLSHIENLKKGLSVNLNILDSLQSFYNASEHVDRDEFSRYVSPLIKKYENIQAIEWVPKVLHNQREAYEFKARKNGFNDYVFTQKDNEKMIPADERAVYYPVFYVEPLKGNEKALGFDLSSNIERLKALDKARKFNIKVASKPIKLVQEKDEQLGVIVFNPIFKEKLKKTKEFEDGLLGFVLIVLRMNDVVSFNLNDHLTDIRVTIKDITNFDNKSILYEHNKDVKIEYKKFNFKEIFNFAGNQWQIEIYPFKRIDDKVDMSIRWLILLSGLGITVFVIYVLILQINHRILVENTVKKRTEELSDAKQRFQLAVEATQDGIWDWPNMEEDKEYWSPRWKALLGYKEYEIEAKASTFFSLLHPDDVNKVENAVQEHLKDNIPFDVEYRLKTKSGEYKWFRGRGLISEHSITGHKRMTGSISDIQYRKETEIQLNKYMIDLEASNKELDEFAYIASHDLKSPLRGIDQLAKWISEDIEIKNFSEVNDNLLMMRGRIKRMESLLSDLLEYSKIGRKQEFLKQVNVKNMVEDLLMLSTPSEKFKLKVKGKLPVFTTFMVPLEQVFRNLFSNAIKHHDREDGSIIVWCDDNKQADFYTFVVQDDGPGIESRHHEVIFKIFKSLKSRDEVEGSGLGLALIKKIVTNYGGEIWVESQVGEGASFYFTWPKTINLT